MVWGFSVPERGSDSRDVKGSVQRELPGSVGREIVASVSPTRRGHEELDAVRQTLASQPLFDDDIERELVAIEDLVRARSLSQPPDDVFESPAADGGGAGMSDLALSEAVAQQLRAIANDAALADSRDVARSGFPAPSGTPVLTPPPPGGHGVAPLEGAQAADPRTGLTPPRQQATGKRPRAWTISGQQQQDQEHEEAEREARKAAVERRRQARQAAASRRNPNEVGDPSEGRRANAAAVRRPAAAPPPSALTHRNPPEPAARKRSGGSLRQQAQRGGQPEEESGVPGNVDMELIRAERKLEQELRGLDGRLQERTCDRLSRSRPRQSPSPCRVVRDLPPPSSVSGISPGRRPLASQSPKPQMPPSPVPHSSPSRPATQGAAPAWWVGSASNLPTPTPAPSRSPPHRRRPRPDKGASPVVPPFIGTSSPSSTMPVTSGQPDPPSMLCDDTMFLLDRVEQAKEREAAMKQGPPQNRSARRKARVSLPRQASSSPAGSPLSPLAKVGDFDDVPQAGGDRLVGNESMVKRSGLESVVKRSGLQSVVKRSGLESVVRRSGLESVVRKSPTGLESCIRSPTSKSSPTHEASRRSTRRPAPLPRALVVGPGDDSPPPLAPPGVGQTTIVTSSSVSSLEVGPSGSAPLQLTVAQLVDRGRSSSPQLSPVQSFGRLTTRGGRQQSVGVTSTSSKVNLRSSPAGLGPSPPPVLDPVQIEPVFPVPFPTGFDETEDAYLESPAGQAFSPPSTLAPPAGWEQGLDPPLAEPSAVAKANSSDIRSFLSDTLAPGVPSHRPLVRAGGQRRGYNGRQKWERVRYVDESTKRALALSVEARDTVEQTRTRLGEIRTQTEEGAEDNELSPKSPPVSPTARTKKSGDGEGDLGRTVKQVALPPPPRKKGERQALDGDRWEAQADGSMGVIQQVSHAIKHHNKTGGVLLDAVGRVHEIVDEKEIEERARPDAREALSKEGALRTLRREHVGQAEEEVKPRLLWKDVWVEADQTELRFYPLAAARTGKVEGGKLLGRVQFRSTARVNANLGSDGVYYYFGLERHHRGKISLFTLCAGSDGSRKEWCEFFERNRQRAENARLSIMPAGWDAGDLPFEAVDF
eukprot:Hpha_TRINITY_DN10650_c0_g1::TRINITY_DN10650_c0_g1_i1::g.156638::m.156638